MAMNLDHTNQHRSDSHFEKAEWVGARQHRDEETCQEGLIGN